MGVLRSAPFTEVLDLHNLGKHRYIDCRLCGFCEVVTLENLHVLATDVSDAFESGSRGTHLMESALVPVFLEELLASFRLLLPQFLSTFHVFLQALFLWKCTTTLDFFALLLPLNLCFLLLLNSGQFPEPPRLELAFGIQAVCIVDVWNISLLLFYIKR